MSIISAATIGQNGTIKGKIKDQTTGTPLPFVNVIVHETNLGAVTDEEGNFEISYIEEGFVTLKASFVGYTSYSSDKIEVKSGKSSVVDINFTPNMTDLEEVVIKVSTFERPEAATNSMQKISIDEIRSNPGANGDISKVIQSYAGVSSGASFRNDIMVRGGGPAENIFYLDEIEVPTINHFQTQGASGGTNSMINSYQLASVDF